MRGSGSSGGVCSFRADASSRRHNAGYGFDWKAVFFRNLLELLQVFHDFRPRPVHGFDELPPDDAAGVNNVSLREHFRSVESIALLFRIADREQIYAIKAQEAVIGLGVLVHTDGQDVDSVFELGLHGNQRGHFLDAWRAPGSPEVQDDHLAVKFMQRDCAVGILHGKIGRKLSNHIGAAATVAATGHG